MEAGDVAERARQRELVRRGYDAISGRYLGADMLLDHADTATYVHWLAAARLAADTASSWPRAAGRAREAARAGGAPMATEPLSEHARRVARIYGAAADHYGLASLGFWDRFGAATVSGTFSPRRRTARMSDSASGIA